MTDTTRKLPLATPEVPAGVRLHILSLCERRSGVGSQPHQTARPRVDRDHLAGIW